MHGGSAALHIEDVTH